MIKIHKLTYNPFSENMYILSDETNECAIIDPGCYTSEERAHLKSYIEENSLKPVKLWNTHCHLDHVFGNYFVVTLLRQILSRCCSRAKSALLKLF